MRIQTRIKNRRDVSAGVTKEINRRIEQTAAKFDCSKSFVVNTMLAEAFGIAVTEVYYRPKEFSMVLNTHNSKVIPMRRKQHA